ncbi:Repeat domain-containing protein [Micromonospora echinaurantiaca]|uniref:Repeat domain-containing protein n=1 Tax=Micromonospora echinaurantiaca TaxID=47857 RepID=A0A1C5IGR5_9ACTN|nr:Repeat domain-containing protein [Micromonospora echinaurantiaca]
MWGDYKEGWADHRAQSQGSSRKYAETRDLSFEVSVSGSASVSASAAVAEINAEFGWEVKSALAFQQQTEINLTFAAGKLTHWRVGFAVQHIHVKRTYVSPYCDESVTQGTVYIGGQYTASAEVDHPHYGTVMSRPTVNFRAGGARALSSGAPIYFDDFGGAKRWYTPGVFPGINVVEQTEYADIDGDGRRDLIGVSGPNNDLTAYRNQGWSASSGVIVGWDRKSLVSGFGDASRTTFADIDGDGRADLISVSGPNNDITAYRNQGWNSANGVIVGWDRKLLASGFGSLDGLKFADIDGDRRADLIATTGANNDVTVYRNQGWNASSGVIVGWDRKPLVSGFGGSLEFDFADIDGDRRADLVAASGANNDLTVYRNQGWNASSGVIVGWDRKALVSGFGALWPLKLADIDGDLRSDVVAVSGVNNDHTAYRNQGWSSTALIVGWDRRSITSGFAA